MIKGKIFLADDRGVNQTNWYRSFNTFNFGKYQLESKKPFGNLVLLNDDEIDSSRSVSMLVEEDFYVMILPVAGAVIYTDNMNGSETVAAGQVLLTKATPGLKYELINPFAEGIINVLHIWIKPLSAFAESSMIVNTYGDVNNNINSLSSILPQDAKLPFQLSIGKFSGRGETVYKTTGGAQNIFLFVLCGAFEAEGRLLHEKDGLSLWETNRAEMEALSNDALLLCIEQPGTM